MSAPYDKRRPGFPLIEEEWPIRKVVCVIRDSLCASIDAPYSFDQLRSSPYSTTVIRPLVNSLKESKHKGIIAGLMAVRLEFSGDEDDESLSMARAVAAELLAIRYVNNISGTQLIEYTTYEIGEDLRLNDSIPSTSSDSRTKTSDEETPLLEPEHSNSTPQRNSGDDDVAAAAESANGDDDEGLLLFDSSIGLNALELAVLSEAKKFLSSRPIEAVLQAIWAGDIVFWDSISVESHKKITVYNGHCSDYYSRLRVPRYRAIYMLFYYVVIILFLFAVLFWNFHDHFTATELIMDILFAGLVYEEITQITESGSLEIYISDYWSLFDVTVDVIFLIFVGMRIYAINWHNDQINDLAFQVLSLSALILIPRAFSCLSTLPYFGTLLPCLRDMVKEFLKFLIIIVVIYCGFLTTFSFLGRDHYSPKEMAWLLVRVFFGNSGSGFDAAKYLTPTFGSPLMLVFVTMTNVLLVTVLISILSQKFSTIMLNAKEEYFLMFGSLVLETITTSDRVTYFYPPLNILSLMIRPLRYVLPRQQYRSVRIAILKVTHAPFVGILLGYEYVISKVTKGLDNSMWSDEVTPKLHNEASKKRLRLARAIYSPLHARHFARGAQAGTGSNHSEASYPSGGRMGFGQAMVPNVRPSNESMGFVRRQQLPRSSHGNKNYDSDTSTPIKSNKKSNKKADFQKISKTFGDTSSPQEGQSKISLMNKDHKALKAIFSRDKEIPPKTQSTPDLEHTKHPTSSDNESQAADSKDLYDDIKAEERDFGVVDVQARSEARLHHMEEQLDSLTKSLQQVTEALKIKGGKGK